MAGMGHEDPFPPRWLNVRCVIRHGTFAETNGQWARCADSSHSLDLRPPLAVGGQHQPADRLDSSSGRQNAGKRRAEWHPCCCPSAHGDDRIIEHLKSRFAALNAIPARHSDASKGAAREGASLLTLRRATAIQLVLAGIKNGRGWFIASMAGLIGHSMGRGAAGAAPIPESLSMRLHRQEESRYAAAQPGDFGGGTR
jgi:hypothetical protein